MRSLLIGLMAVFLCACSVTPQYCRSLGVDVPDGASITGRVIEEHIADQKKVSAMCGAKGCAKQVRPGEWVIWSIDDSLIRAHEACHALYQKIGHSKFGDTTFTSRDSGNTR